MMGCKVLIILAVASLTSEIVSAATDKIVCYYGSWSLYRVGNGQFLPEDIDPTLCTHLIYAFVSTSTDGTIKTMDSNLVVNHKSIKRFNALKQLNPNVKTLVAMGGWNEGSILYSGIAADASKRANLVKSAIAFLQDNGFDGFDLDWEYPAQRGGAGVDKQNFVLLMQDLRKEFDKHGYLLTAAVAATAGSVDLSYDVPALSKYLDFINVMAYDLHGSYEGRTGQNAPLYPSTTVDTTAASKLLTVDASIRGWIERGAEPQKLVLGLGSYGRSYTLSSSSANYLGAPVLYAGNPGPYTIEAGMLGFNEICELQNQGGWKVQWDDDQKVPFMSKGNQWVGYDDIRSIEIKADYAKELGLGGVMLWSLETEDFRGICGEKYPLLKAVQKKLASGSSSSGSSGSNSGSSSASSSSSSSSTKSTSTSTTTTTTSASKPKDSVVNPGGVCTEAGYIRDPLDCNAYYYCFPFNGDFVPLRMKCNAGLHYNDKTLICDYPANVQCVV